jgi:hypothetical protein
VDTNTGHSWGTGTIIDTRKGPEGQEALILTCGHIFQGYSPDKNSIEVHLFSENSTVKAFGKYLCHDLDMDLALVSIAPHHPVRAIPIAPDGYQIRPYQQAWSVGCDHGGTPTVQPHQVMSVDKVFEQKVHGKPFYFVQVSGAPVSGRSGGGLFSAEGYLIGVCNTGDPVANDGHFVPPHMIRYLLDQRNLADVYTNPSLGVPTTPPPMALAALTPLEPIGELPAQTAGLVQTAGPARTFALAQTSGVRVGSPPMAATPVPAVALPMVAENRGNMSREERATLGEI